MDDSEEYEMMIKVILIGDSGVGKTNIMSKFLKNQFLEDSKATVGVEFGSKLFIQQGHKIKAQIWDTAGQEKYKAITSAYYKGSKGALVIYDISRKATFENVDKWVEELKNNGSEDVLIMLVGNKSDLKEQREIAEEDAKKKAELYNAAFCETSALEGYNIEYAFENLINEITKKVEKEREEKVGKNNGRNRMEGKMITLDTNNDKGGNSNDNKNNLIGDKKMCC